MKGSTVRTLSVIRIVGVTVCVGPPGVFRHCRVHECKILRLNECIRYIIRVPLVLAQPKMDLKSFTEYDFKRRVRPNILFRNVQAETI